MAKILREAIAYKMTLTLLIEYHYSQKQLQELTGVGPTTIARWLSTFHQGPKNLIYISKYERSATVGPYTAFWAFGYMMPDAPKPPPLSRVEKNSRLRRRRQTSSTETGVIHVSY